MSHSDRSLTAGDGSESSSDGGDGAATGSAAMAEFQKHWDGMSVQARTTAKWIATALGAGLAALVGTTPLSALQGKEIPQDALIVAALGLVALGLTIFLVLRVLVPGITGFGEPMGTERRGRNRRSPFHKLQEKAESGDGVMLPIGIESLAELGKRAAMEAETLNKLAIAISDEDKKPAPDADRVAQLKQAQRQRGQWLALLTNEIIQWTSVDSYAVVKRSADQARSLGLLCGILGTAALDWAFLQPQPAYEAVTLSSYHIDTTSTDSTVAADVTALGADCAKSFRGVITGIDDTKRQVTVLVQPTKECKAASVVVSAASLTALPAS